MADREYIAMCTNKWDRTYTVYDLQPIESGGTALDLPKVCHEDRYPLMHRCYNCVQPILRNGNYCAYCGASFLPEHKYAALMVFMARIQYPLLMPTEAAANSYVVDEDNLKAVFPGMDSLDPAVIKGTFQAHLLTDLLDDIAKLEADTSILEFCATATDYHQIADTLKDFLTIS